MDQRMIEFELWERHSVPCIRLTLAEVRVAHACTYTASEVIVYCRLFLGMLYCTWMKCDTGVSIAACLCPLHVLPAFITCHPWCVLLSQINACGELDEARRLWLRCAKRGIPESVDLEVSVAYFRAGYTPVDYPTDAEWAARLLIEQSVAIKASPFTFLFLLQLRCEGPIAFGMT